MIIFSDFHFFQYFNFKKDFINFVFLISKENGQASSGIIDIPTRLAPQNTSILCRHTQKIYSKMEK